jgi:hypothetical protein
VMLFRSGGSGLAIVLSLSQWTIASPPGRDGGF